MSKEMYGNRPGPSTVPTHAATILQLFKGTGKGGQPKVVTFEDMQKATGRTWVRRFFHAAKQEKPNIVAIKDGRKLVGFTLARGRQVAANVNDDRTTSARVSAFKAPPGFKLVKVDANEAEPKKRGRPRKVTV